MNCMSLSIMLLILFLGVLYYLNYMKTKNESFGDTSTVILNARPPVVSELLKPYVMKEISLSDNKKLDSNLLLYLTEIYHAPQII
jgi:hypothetical protein